MFSSAWNAYLTSPFYAIDKTVRYFQWEAKTTHAITSISSHLMIMKGKKKAVTFLIAPQMVNGLRSSDEAAKFICLIHISWKY